MEKTKNQPSEINAGSMADIAFLLLIFFLVTTTIEADQGILVRLPPIILDENIIKQPTYDRNFFPVLINGNDDLMVKQMPIMLDDLKNSTIRFITNPTNDPNLSESPNLALVSLKNDRGTSYHMYIQVQNEIKAAYQSIWDNEAQTSYNSSYNNLSIEKQKQIRSLYPRRFSEAEQ